MKFSEKINYLNLCYATDCFDQFKCLFVSKRLSQYVQTIEHRQGLKVACLEEIAYQNGWIDKTLLLERAKAFGKTGYGQYLFKLAGERA